MSATAGPPSRVNALAREQSPYLRQHMHNPVDWLPWGEPAFARARAEQKPIFLSVGYATCHWCHVMAHESFEDATVAAILNAHFVPVKVDREERPDVDRIYMTYVQAATGRGGWPMSVWLTPELKPFYGGTYFPPEDYHGRPGFVRILNVLAEAWTRDRAKLTAEADRITAMLREHAAGGAATGAATAPVTFGEAAGDALQRGYQHCYESFDSAWGGWGGAPKFPRPAGLNFLFRVAVLQGPQSKAGAEALRMAAVTLQKMAEGGLHDHVGGGFHRYSVDAEWFVPHFEKMLYDQAQLAISYLDARQATGHEVFAWVARGIFDYVRRDLTSPAGGFYSAEDADSAVGAGAAEHAEGAFYVWTHEEIDDVLGADAAFFCAHFGVEAGGNVPAVSDPHGEFRGKNILRQRRPLAATAAAFKLGLSDANDRLLAGLKRLRERRSHRPRPLRDEKIITAWNGLMISALAKGAQVLGEAGHLAAATRAAEFVERELYDPATGTLFRRHCAGRSGIAGFAEDYACLIQGLLDLYETGFDVRWLQWAERLQAKMDALFWDAAGGGYFNSRADDTSVIVRMKEDYDGAEPTPCSVAALNLLRLEAMAGGEKGAGREEPREGDFGGYRERGMRTIEALRGQWHQAPHLLPQLLCAFELALAPPRTVVVAGDPAAGDFRALTAVLHERPGPRRTILAADGGAGQQWLAERRPELAEMKPQAGRATAYVCEEYTCRAPVTTPEELRRQLQS
jgi:uncharacterized protein YyaL (SSP411 family)